LEIRQELHEAVVSSNTAYPLEKLAAPNVEGQSVPEELGITYDGLSGLCRMLSLYTQSVEFSEKAIEILELLPKNKSWAWSMMTALGNYGATLGKLVRLSEAEQAGRRAVKIGEEMLPDTDPELPRVYNALSIILKKQKRFSEAEPLCKQSIRLREKVLGPNHSDLSSSLMNLGNIYAKMGLLHEAITAYNRAYQITVQVQGERHPYAAQCKYSTCHEWSLLLLFFHYIELTYILYRHW
jgi:tetratricopeptide (TPR) repeat protein